MVYNKGWRQQGVSPSELLHELGWEPLDLAARRECREKQRLTMLYKISNDLVAVPPPVSLNLKEKLVDIQENTE